MSKEQVSSCFNYQLKLYWRSGKEKSKDRKLNIVIKTIFKILISSFLGFFIFRLLLLKTTDVGFAEQIFLLHGYLFLFFFVRCLYIHPLVFDNKKDKAFFRTKPIDNKVRVVSIFLFTLYILGITVLPAIISAVVFAAFYWSISTSIILFLSLGALSLIGLATSGVVFYIVKIFIKGDFFPVFMTIVRSCMNILIWFLIDAAKYYRGPVERVWYFLPGTSNIIFFENFNLTEVVPFVLSIFYPIITVLLFIALVNKNLRAGFYNNIVKCKNEEFPVFCNEAGSKSISKLYKKIMAGDKIYKMPIYATIGSLFSLPFFAIAYNLRFGNSGELFTFNMYFMTILWCFLLFSVNFTEGSYSESPRAGWLVFVLQSKPNENKRTLNSIILKRIFILGVLPLIAGLSFYLSFGITYIYTVSILLLTFLTSFLLAINSNYKNAEPFSCEQSYKGSDESFDIAGIFLLLPIVYALYVLGDKYYTLKIILPVILVILFLISFFRSIYGAKYIKNSWSQSNECNRVK